MSTTGEVVPGVVDALVNAIMRLNEKCVQHHADKKSRKQTRVWQGRSPVASHEFEIGLAEELAECLPGLHFFVDYPVSVQRTSRRPATYYPDIMAIEHLQLDTENPRGDVVGTGTVVGLVDVKVDLGYVNAEFYGLDRRDGTKPAKFNQRETELGQAETWTCNYRVGGGSQGEAKQRPRGNKIILTPIGRLTKVAIVCTAANEHKHATAEAFGEALHREGYRLLVLLKNRLHPNDGPLERDEVRENVKSQSSQIGEAFGDLLKKV